MIPSQFFRRQNGRSTARRQDNRRRFLLEPLEGRQLLSTFTVTNASDSGPGSFRQAIISSDSSPGSTANAIKFDIGTGGGQTISLKSALPAITVPVIIDGTTQPGTGTTPGIVLNGSSAGENTDGLKLEASGSTVKGLVIDSFSGSGVLVSGASSDTITDDYIGVTAAGNVAAGNGYDGVHFIGGAQGNIVSDDVISANVARGVDIDGGSKDNTVEGCMIGTDVTGTKPLGNGDSGVLMSDGASDNVVGGTTAAARNVISANLARGVNIDGSSGNLVEGNFIGTDSTGTQPLGNAFSGVLITDGANDNVVGGTTAAARNVISANGYRGVHIFSSSGNLVAGNDIGTDVSGTKPLGNLDSGVLVDGGSSANIIGGTTPGAGNTISYNGGNGVHIEDGSDGNLIEGDTIDENTDSGVYIECSTNITVSGCVIENNGDWGILATVSSGFTFTSNTVAHNGLGGVND